MARCFVADFQLESLRSEAHLLPALNYLLASKHLDMPGRWYDVEVRLRSLRSDERFQSV